MSPHAIKLWLKGPIKHPTEERERVCLEFPSLLRIFWVDLINFCCIPPTCLACNSKLWQNYNRVTLYKSTVPWHFLRNGRNQLFNYNKWNSMITGKRYIGREKLIAAALAGSQPAPWITPDHDTGAGSAATHPLIIIIIIENAITKGTGQVAFHNNNHWPNHHKQ